MLLLVIRFVSSFQSLNGLFYKRSTNFEYSTFVHNKLLPLIRLSYAELGCSYTADEQTFRAIAQWRWGLSPELYLVSTECQKGGSQWPRGRGSEAARLRVRIPPVEWMSVVSVVCSPVEVSATGRSLVQRSPTDCTVVPLGWWRGATIFCFQRHYDNIRLDCLIGVDQFRGNRNISSYKFVRLLRREYLVQFYSGSTCQGFRDITTRS